MSTEDERPVTPGNGAGRGEKVFSLEKIYVKDLSFEVPHAPEVFDEDQLETKVDMNLQNSHRRLGENKYEIVLHVELRATVGERTMFLVEIDQAGIFLLGGYDGAQLRRLVSAVCPSVLYPYVREAVSGAINRGGFPSVLLQPINFEALYARSEAERAAAAESDDAAGIGHA